MSEDTIIKGAQTLGLDINKQKMGETQETTQGVVSEKYPELNLEMSDEDILKLTTKWEKDWKDSPKKTDWEKQGQENEDYWLGKQYESVKADKTRPNIDNLIFESLETYLPQVTRRNPEPLVMLDATEVPEGSEPDPVRLKYIDKVKARLSDLADKNKLRLKLKKAGRHWAIYLLGVAKFGWDLDKNIPAVRIVRPTKLILDPDALIDEDGYTGNRIGEYRKMEAGKILSVIGEENEQTAGIKAINELVNNDKSTDVQFIEWWTAEYMCWTLGSNVLLKKKNPHWNYDVTEQQESVDDYGNATTIDQPKPGINHLPVPAMPYIFLTVFNLGDQPMDRTSLISQNLSNQDKINKRNKQIDKNVDRQNGGMVVSLARAGLTQAQAKNVTETLRKGGVVAIPDGAPEEAIQQYSPNNLPSDVFNDLYDTRNRLRDIFGTKGSTPAGIESEKLATGKIMSRNLDTDRIGGGVSEYLEQFADDIYNWFVQLLYVYDTAFQFIEGAVPPKLVISVKEGSLLPKDSIAIANQALTLAELGRISNLDLYKRLDYPNPEEMAANVWLEVNAPEMLYKDNPMVQQVVMMKQQAMQAEAQQTQQNKEQEQQNKLETEVVKADLKNNNKNDNGNA
ncbi:MAG: hypothetical protein WC047_08740 [Kiritimatiellales bacterium]